MQLRKLLKKKRQKETHITDIPLEVIPMWLIRIIPFTLTKDINRGGKKFQVLELQGTIILKCKQRNLIQSENKYSI